MAAFINALAEEGTNKDIMHWITRMRDETRTTHPPFIAYMDYTREQLLAELIRLWEIRRKTAIDVC